MGLVISTLYLNATHDLLHMDSRLAVNVNTIIGIGLATVFRFWAYRQFVFAGEHPGDPEAEAAELAAVRAGRRTRVSDSPDAPRSERPQPARRADSWTTASMRRCSSGMASRSGHVTRTNP